MLVNSLRCMKQNIQSVKIYSKLNISSRREIVWHKTRFLVRVLRECAFALLWARQIVRAQSLHNKVDCYHSRGEFTRAGR